MVDRHSIGLDCFFYSFSALLLPPTLQFTHFASNTFSFVPPSFNLPLPQGHFLCTAQRLNPFTAFFHFILSCFPLNPSQQQSFTLNKQSCIINNYHTAGTVIHLDCSLLYPRHQPNLATDSFFLNFSFWSYCVQQPKTTWTAAKKQQGIRQSQVGGDKNCAYQDDRTMAFNTLPYWLFFFYLWSRQVVFSFLSFWTNTSIYKNSTRQPQQSKQRKSNQSNAKAIKATQKQSKQRKSNQSTTKHQKTHCFTLHPHRVSATTMGCIGRTFLLFLRVQLFTNHFPWLHVDFFQSKSCLPSCPLQANT
jgi:hypothetical protein